MKIMTMDKPMFRRLGTENGLLTERLPCLFTCVFVFVILDQCLCCVFEFVEFVMGYLNAHPCIWVCNFVSLYLNLLKRFILMPTCGQPRKQLATRCVCTVIFWLYSEYTASHSTMRCGKIIPHYTYCTFCFTFFYSKIVKPCTTFFCACTLNTFFHILLYSTFYIHLCTNIALQLFNKRNTLRKLCSAFVCSTFY